MTKYEKKEVIEKLEAGLKSGLWNCHVPGLHSVILEEKLDGSLVRIFFTDSRHRLNELFTPTGHFTLGAHNHDKELCFTSLYGDVLNVDVVLSRLAPNTLYQYDFQSALTTGEFSLGAPKMVGAIILVRPIDGVCMQPESVHTVLVNTPHAAWLVEEGPTVPLQKQIYSPREDLQLSKEGLYQSMSERNLTDIQQILLENIRNAEN